MIQLNELAINKEYVKRKSTSFNFFHRRQQKVGPGALVGRYSLEDEIGRGGTGVVYRARDLRLERLVALKINYQEVGARSPGWGRLLREARLASALSHPSICTIYDVGEDGGLAYIAMEYIAGIRLSGLLVPAGLPNGLVNHFGRLISNAIAYAHEHGIIHGDIKPANAIATGSGQPKILDFGLAKHLSSIHADTAFSPSSSTDSGCAIGTFPYMAPEVLRGKRRGIWSDIWSLGVLLYELATGKLPFRGSTAFELATMIMISDPIPASREMPPVLREVICRCLRKEPHLRYHRAQEIAEELSRDSLPSLTACWREYTSSLGSC